MFASSKSGSVSAPTDSKFNYVTMLLHGNGTNGAQNNTFVDSSTNNFTITRNGNTTQGTFTPYGSNWSNYFDGTGDYLSVANNAALQWSTGDFCVEAWIYPNSVSGSKAIVCKGTNDAGTFDLGLYGTKIELYTTALVFSSSASLSANTWTHVAVTRSGTTLRCFINGALDTTVTSSYNFNNAGTFYVGVYGSGSVNYFNGYMSNVRCVKGSAVYTSAFTPSTTPLTAITNTSLLTCADNRFIDDSTNNFTITKNGDVSVQRFSPFNPTTAYSTSVIGGSGYFDGSGDYLTAAANTAFVFGSGDFTVETWIYPTLWPTDAFVVSNLSNGDTSWGIEIYGGNIRFTGWTTVWLSATQPSTNSWHHVAVSRSGTTLSMFVDGVRVATTTNSVNFSANNTLVVGDYIPAGGANFNGYISNVRLVKGTAVYSPSSSTLTVPTAPLTAISGTSFLTNFTNAGILDNAMMNDLETVGNAQISTSVKKYGTGSMAFDGTDDRLTSATSPNIAFGTGDFTVEAWIYTNTLSGERGFIQTSDTAGGLKTSYTTGILFAIGVSPYTLNVNVGNTNVSSGTTYLAINTWYHVAVTRSSGSVRLFINGTLVGGPTTITANLTGQNVCIGGYYNTSYLWNGYIDDLRITKGFARYTSNFTAPTAAFPDKG